MRFSLLGKTVVTESGTVLGKVRNAEALWPDLHVAALDVRPTLSSLLGQKYLIDSSAVVRVEKDRLVVKDSMLPEKAIGVVKKIFSATSAPKPSVEARTRE